MRPSARVRLGATLAVVLLGVLAAPALAAPKDGCSAAQSGWTLTSVEDATDYVWPRLLDTSLFGDKDGLEESISTYDRNGDGNICFLTMWGEKLNPKSHWYQVGLEVLGQPTEQMFVRENTANASH